MAENDVTITNEEPVEPEFIPNGVSFDGLHSYTHFGLWLAARPQIGSPSPKLNTVEVPGMDGIIDMTEANAGEVKFTNREIVLTFSAMVSIADQAGFKSQILNALHGRRIERIVLDEDSNWHYSGRCSVRFDNIKPWKLKCIISVDADPYAQKNQATEISLDPDNYSQETESIVIGQKDLDSSAYYASDWKLGTKEFPDGVPVGMGFDRIAINWNLTTVRWTAINKTVRIYDSDDNVYTGTFSPNKSDCGFDVLYTDIQNAGVDLSKVYRIRINNIGNCWPSAQQVLVYVPVQNARKETIPTFYLSNLYPAEIMIGGVVYTIQPRGPQTNESIVLRSGLNKIYLPTNSPHNFSMVFQEGKL